MRVGKVPFFAKRTLPHLEVATPLLPHSDSRVVYNARSKKCVVYSTNMNAFNENTY